MITIIALIIVMVLLIIATTRYNVHPFLTLILAALAVSLSTGLYATHVFVPPTPGPLAAAGTLGADIGLVLLLGLVVAIPSALAGWLWARHSGKNISLTNNDNGEVAEENTILSGTYKSFAPIVFPIILIALKSIADYPSAPFGDGIFYHIIIFVGNPVVALLIGVFLGGFSIFQYEHSDCPA